MSIVSSRRLQFMMPKMRSQLAESLQVISGSIYFYIYAILGELLFTKGNHVMPSFSIIWKSKGSHLTVCLILNLSLSVIMPEAGRFILFPFKVMLTPFQSNSITSQSIFVFNLICININNVKSYNIYCFCMKVSKLLDWYPSIQGTTAVDNSGPPSIVQQS